MPQSSQLAQMKFNMYQEMQREGSPKRIKKRVLKSAYKALKYEASSLNADIKVKAQACDYYMGVFDSVKNKCYAMPVDSAYQMIQNIDGFQAKFGMQSDMDVKNMTYHD